MSNTQLFPLFVWNTVAREYHSNERDVTHPHFKLGELSPSRHRHFVPLSFRVAKIGPEDRANR